MKGSLEKYNEKRDFTQTKEPQGEILAAKDFRFVIQKHDATRLHYDFRIQHHGVLKSWAVPKGPPYKNSEKHLAMMVEDHPVSYFDFEGTIPEGNYGAGNVIVWDWGNYWVPHANDENEVIEMIDKGYEKGEIKLILNGKKVKGLFALVRFKKAGENAWLMIKDKDEFEGINFFEKDQSVKSGETLDEIEEKTKTVGLEYQPPMLATLGKAPFDSPDYIFEEKLDGYRIIAVVNKDKVELFSRKGELMNNRFPDIVKNLSKLDLHCVLDGEVVAYDKNGKSSFQLIQDHESERNIIYHIFDILNLNGISTLDLPLLQRKNFLKKALKGKKKNIVITKYLEGKGIDLFQKTLGKTEGIMAKKVDSKYFPGERSNDWIKIKNQLRQEFVIGGITKPKGKREEFGSLVVGYFKGKKLIYCGHIGTGFDQKLMSSLMNTFKKIKRDNSPFANYSGDKSLQFWVEPIIVCEATFAEWTKDKMIRQASFMGIRTDKFPKQATKEETILDSILTHPNKIYWPERGYTKLDLSQFYFEIAPILLPYLKDRPQNLNRFPDGINGQNFYHKDIEWKVPDFVEIAKIKRDKPKLESDGSKYDKNISYILCQNVETLIFMANLGCIEIHPWLSRVGSLETPDFLIFDIDPNNVDFKIVVEVAKNLYEFLEKIGLNPFIKTSGKRGIHLYIGLGNKYTYDDSRNFAHLIATIMEKKYPEIISLERSPDKRKGKVYIDYLQNRQGQTTASVYSVRPTQNASVSTPLHFSELNSKLDPSKFTIKNTLKRLEKHGDLWKGIRSKSVDLDKVLNKLKNSLKSK